jgi:GT2 family glycosyltransferase
MMRSGPSVSIVIPNWNGADLLPACLRALHHRQGVEFDLIVVDNGSFDASLLSVSAIFPDATVLRLGENFGFAVAANKGAALANGEYIGFLNSDARPEPGWLLELIQCLERHPRAAAATPKLLRCGTGSCLDGAGDAMTWSLKAYRRGAGELDVGQFEDEERVFAAPATAVLWRAEAFRALGGFDESFFAYYEDVDIGFRALLAGYEAWYAPRAVARHLGSATSVRDRRQFENFHAVANRWRVVVKNTPLRWCLLRAHLIVLGELASLARSLCAGAFRLHLAAYREVLTSLPRLVAARRELDPSAANWSDLSAHVQRAFPPAKSRAIRRTECSLGLPTTRPEPT